MHYVYKIHKKALREEEEERGIFIIFKINYIYLCILNQWHNIFYIKLILSYSKFVSFLFILCTFFQRVLCT